MSSDDGRKGFGQELKEKVTPQEEKSTVDKIKETFTGAGDKAQRDAVPDDQKGIGQQVKDKVSRS